MTYHHTPPDWLRVDLVTKVRDSRPVTETRTHTAAHCAKTAITATSCMKQVQVITQNVFILHKNRLSQNTHKKPFLLQKLIRK